MRIARSLYLSFPELSQSTDPVWRTYAATSQASPGQSSNVQQPTSDSAAESEVKSSRATESDKSPDTASVQNPVSETSTGGQDEEGTDPMKQNPDKPAGEKAKETEKQGQTPLDPADK